MSQTGDFGVGHTANYMKKQVIMEIEELELIQT
jgi:hypothetical protein